MKKLIKLLPIVMTVFMVFTAIAPVLASQTVLDGLDPQTGDTGAFVGVGERVLGIIQVVGTIIAVGVLMVIGIKYMMGSAEEKAEYKKTMLPYIIGAVILFAAVNIAKAVVGLANSVTAG